MSNPTKAEAIKQIWSDALKEIKVVQTPSMTAFLIPENADNYFVIGIHISEDKKMYAVAKLMSESDLQDYSPSVEEKSQNFSLLSSMASGKNSIVSAFPEKIMERMTFLSEKEKESVLPRLQAGWEKKIHSLLLSQKLDIDTLKILGHETFAPASTTSYTYFSDKSVPEEIRSRRLEAAKHYPILANYIASFHSLRAVVDANIPLAPALIEFSPRYDGKNIFSKWMVKRLANNQFEGTVPTVRTLAVLSELPPDWFPKDEENMRAAVEVVENILDLYNGNTKIALNNCNGRWVELRNSYLLAFADTRNPEGASKEDMEYLEKSLNFKALQKESAAGNFTDIRKFADNIEKDFPVVGGLTKQSIADFIRRKYAPYNGPGAMEEAREAADMAISILHRKMVIPAVLTRIGARSTNITSPSMANLLRLSQSMVMDGKSPLAAFRNIRKMKNAEGVMISLGKKITESEVKAMEEEISQQTAVKSSRDSEGFHVFSDEDKDIMKNFHSFHGGRIAWRHLSGPFVLGNIAIVPLISPEDIYYESMAMSHCIGDYYIDKCRSEESFNYSIRRKNDDGSVQPIATMEIASPYYDRKKLRIEQIKARNNTSKIPADAANVIGLFKSEVFPTFAENEDLKRGFIKASARRQESMKEHEKQYNIGYDWHNMNNVEKVYEFFADFFGKEHRKGLDNFIKSPTILDIAVSIDSRLKPKTALSPSREM